MANPATLINQSSGKTHYYTPPHIVDACWRVMGGIDLDPASDPLGNCHVRAVRFFSEADNGLSQIWAGRVFMNHPFARAEKACGPGCTKKVCQSRGHHITTDLPGNEAWINYLQAHYEAGLIECACCLTFASTSEDWFKPLMQYPQCYLQPRTNYILPDGTLTKDVPKGSVVTYLGLDRDRFHQEFKLLGSVMFPASTVPRKSAYQISVGEYRNETTSTQAPATECVNGATPVTTHRRA